MSEKSVNTESVSAKVSERVYGAGHKLIGKNYPTPDLYAKVTGQAKYAEDYHADGMLFCKLLLSPLPHARVKHIDTRAALAMPGVKAILTADELPPPADSLTDNGTVIKANLKSERGLTMEPLYQGEPILAVAAVDELTAAEAIEKIRIDFEPLPFVIDPLETLRPGGPNPRMEGNVWVQAPAGTAAAGAPPASPPPPSDWRTQMDEGDFADAKEGQLPMGKTPDEWSYGDLDAGFKNAALVLDETFVTPDTSHQTLETRTRDGLLAERQSLRLHGHAEHRADRAGHRAMVEHRSRASRPHQRIHRRRLRQQDHGRRVADYSRAALEEGQRAGDDAHQPRRGNLHRTCAAQPDGPNESRLLQRGRITALDMFVISNNGPYDANGDVPSSGRIVSLLYQPQAMRWRGVDGADEHAAAQCAEFAGRHAGHRHHGADHRESRAQTRARSSGHPPHQLSGRQGAVRTGGAGRQAASRDQRIPQGSARPRCGTIQLEREGRAHSEADRHEGARRRRIAELLRGRHDRLRWAARHQARWPGPTSSPESAIWGRSR